MDGLKNATTLVDVPPWLPKLLFLEASQGLPNLQTQISAVVLLIYDILITFDQEVELIWKARNSVVKFVFLFIRYVALCQGIVTVVLLGGDFKAKHNICKIYAWYYSMSGIFLLAGVDIILIYRAFAFYERDRRVLIGLVILWFMNGTATVVLSVLTSLRFPITYSLTFFIPGIIGECSATSFPYVLHDVWISELIYQSILFFLVLGRFVKITIRSWNKSVGMSSLYLVFIRDGVWAYLLLFGLFIGCTVWNEITILSWIQWVFVFTEVTGTRLVLNLRSLYAHSNNESEDTTSMSNWRIASTSLPKWAGINKEVVFDTILEPPSNITSRNIGVGFSRLHTHTQGHAHHRHFSDPEEVELQDVLNIRRKEARAPDEGEELS